MIETTIYNPASLTKESLIDNFVVRTKVFEKIFEDLKTADMKYPEQHYLIQGQRGMGKTTLLLRLKYEVENTPDLRDWLIPVFFNEESYDITSLSNLWEKLLKYLDEFFETSEEYYNHTEQFVDQPDYEKRCFEYLLQVLDEKKRKLVIFFDNFGQLFLDNLKGNEQRRLREILMNCNDIRIIGSSAIVLSDLHDYSEPFYEFFKIIPLKGLDKDETFYLISKLQEKADLKIDLKKNKGKIETLAILTGGVVRTLMLVYEVLLADHDGSALRDLEMVLDRITPLFKHRIEDLPVQQRKIIDVIAKQWDAVSAKEIASFIREDGKALSTKLISAQLQQLEKNNVVEKKTTNTKNHLYQLKERFFNIWYLMRYGDRKDKRKVKWLTKFLELWYDDEAGFDFFLKRHIEHLQTGKYHAKSAILLLEALANSDKLNVMSLDQFINAASKILNDEQRRLLPDITKRKIVEALKLHKKREYDESIKILESISERGDKENLMLALNFVEKHDYEAGLDVLKTLDCKDNDDIFMLAVLYFMCSNPKKSIEIIRHYKGKKDGNYYGFIGEILYESGEFKEAKKMLIKALKLGNDRAHGFYVRVLIKLEEMEAAEEYLLKKTKNGGFEKELIEFYLFTDKSVRSFEKIENVFKSITKDVIEKDCDFQVYRALNLLIEADTSDNDLLEKEGIKLLNKAKERYSDCKIKTKAFFLMYHLLVTYYINNKDKLAVTNFLGELGNDIKPTFELYGMFIRVWNSNYHSAIEDFNSYLIAQDFKIADDGLKLVNNIFLLLLARKQYHSVIKIFNANKNLKEIFKPTYYALMIFLKVEYPNEHLKMGKELKQPVQDVMTRIKEMKKEYK